MMKLGSFSGSEESEEILMSLKGSGPMSDYLRCQVFHSYKKGSWKENTADASELKPKSASGSEHIYSVSEDFSQDWNYKVTLVTDMGVVLPAPQGALQVMTETPLLYEKPNSLFRLRPQMRPLTYMLSGGQSSLSKCGPECVQSTTSIPEGLRGPLNPVAQDITKGAVSDLEKAKAVSKYFSGFEYSLERRRKKRVDPIEDFLFESRKGYCQDFASAAVMLLRSVDVPARVVAGFLIREQAHSSGENYIVRVRDAHAWCEVYDRENENWVMFDPTPTGPMNAALGIKRPSYVDQMIDRLRISLRLFSDKARRLNIKEFLINIDPVDIGIGIGSVFAFLFLIFAVKNRKLVKLKPKAKKKEFEIDDVPAYYGDVSEKYLQFLNILEKRDMSFKKGDTGYEVLHIVKSSGTYMSEIYPVCEEFINLFNDVRFKDTEGKEVEIVMARFDDILREINEFSRKEL